MDYLNLLSSYWQRGVTFRKTANGKKPMYHRWHYSKIKGSVRILDLMVDNITRNNALLRRLTSNKDRRISPRDR